MKRIIVLLLIFVVAGTLLSCASADPAPQIAATTLPVYEFTSRLCDGTGLSVGRLVTESVSCLHDYSLQVSQMRMLEGAQTVVISGGGLEDFLSDALTSAHHVIDASEGISLICPDNSGDHAHEYHDDHGHSHDEDPHIWLSPIHAKSMAQNICNELSALYPAYADIFLENLGQLHAELDALQAYGEENLSQLSCREMVTFHDGFAYFAQSFNLTIVKAIEEESGREASASELKALIGIVNHHKLPAVFIEQNGSVSAADVIAAETDCTVYTLDMAMAGSSYFEAMYHNIDTIKEALE